MPEKDGSDDKKSTKSVVNKKQKQLMNKEQLDLTSVAESFGGKIVGEPVELDEFRTGNPVVDTVTTVGKVKTGAAVNPYVGAGVAGWQVGKWLDKLITPRLNPLPKYKSNTQKYEKTKDGYTKLYTKDELETKKKEKEKENEKIIVPDKKEIDKIKVPDKQPQIEPYKEPGKKPETEVNLDKLKNIDKNQKKIVTTNDSDSDTKKDSKTNLSVLPLASNQKVNKNKKTKLRTKKGKDFNFRGLKLPGTPHNVGRRVNPQ